MRASFSALYGSVRLIVILVAIAGKASAAQAPLLAVTIQQVSEVSQGNIGEFAVKIVPEARPPAITLRLKCEIGTGKAEFEDGSTDMVLEKSGAVRIRGIVSNDIPGALTLTAWSDQGQVPAATTFFDVYPQVPEPRIFFEGRDVTGTRQAVTVGQLISLAVILHPGMPIHSQHWSIGEPGDYTGGFVHAPFVGGPQPVIREGPATQFYWVMPGENRAVTYELQLTNGETAVAEVRFDVDGPWSAQIQVDPEKVMISQPTASSSLLGMLEPGISFRAHYYLPEGMLKNFTWVQLIQSDVVTIKDNGITWQCVPKSEPVARVGAGLDTVYPYDTHNPTLDNPRIHLPSEFTEYSRHFHARMYLLWTSGLPNSIVVPLGFVEWAFFGNVARKVTKTSAWVLLSGSGGPSDPVAPFTRSHIYPIWNSLVPYTQVLTCN